MEILLTVIHVITSFVLVVAILLQSGKGGGMGAGFGGASAAGQQIFGGRGAAGFLGKATVILAGVFMATSLALAYISSQPRSALDLTQQPATSIERQVDEIVEPGGSAGAAPEQQEAPVELVPADEQPEPAQENGAAGEEAAPQEESAE